MHYKKLAIPDVILCEPTLFSDARGYFYESFNQKAFNQATGLNVNFVQDNHSQSEQHVLRGLHYQADPHAQGKLVRVTHGEVFDVAVDIRKNSPTFGQWVSALLSADNKQQLWIPPGFAHGFLVLSQQAEFLYKTTDYYHKDAERCIIWNDPQINIQWPIHSPPILSAKDQQGEPLCAYSPVS